MYDMVKTSAWYPIVLSCIPHWIGFQSNTLTISIISQALNETDVFIVEGYLLKKIIWAVLTNITEPKIPESIKAQKPTSMF